MLTEIGRFFFLLGLAVTIVSFIISVFLTAAGVQVPSIVSLAAGLFEKGGGGLALSSAMSLVSKIAIGMTVATGVMYVASIVVGLFTGRQVSFDMGKVAAIAMYVTLYALASNGVYVVVMGLLPLYFMMLPSSSLAYVGSAFAAAVYTLAVVTLGYYLLVRVFGVPAE